MSEAAARPPLSAEEKQVWDYLLEVVGDYERYLADIDNLGLSAPNLLYYRDEIQEMLDEFKGDPRVDFRGVWSRVRELDEIFRTNQRRVVDQIGYANFAQYQIINDPPRTHWWWWLNRFVSPPAPPPTWWQFWKKDQTPMHPADMDAASAQDQEETEEPAPEPPAE